MSYCSSTDIAAEYKTITFGSATSITSSTLATWCSQASARLDTQIGSFYSTPILEASSPISFRLMKMYATQLVQLRVNRALGLKAGIAQDQESFATSAKNIIDEVKDIAERRQLSDAPRASSNKYGFKDYNNTNDVEPIFEIDSEQW